MSEISHQETSSLFKDFVLSGYRAGSRIGSAPIFIAEAGVKLGLTLLKLIITAPGWLFQTRKSHASETVNNFHELVGAVIHKNYKTNKVFLALNIAYGIIFYPIHLAFKLLELLVGIICGLVGALIGVVLGGMFKFGQIAWHGIQKLKANGAESSIEETYDFADIFKFVGCESIAAYDNSMLYDSCEYNVDFGSEIENKVTGVIAKCFRMPQYILDMTSAPLLNYTKDPEESASDEDLSEEDDDSYDYPSNSFHKK